MSRQLYADLPPDLHEADELLRRYARWARGGHSPARCGSAEGAYRAPQDDEDRQPTEPAMPAGDVERVRRSLATLPMMTLCIIQWLYVKPGTLDYQMRKHGLQPRHLRERHRDGVRLFWSAWEVMHKKDAARPVAMRSVVVENAVTT